MKFITLLSFVTLASCEKEFLLKNAYRNIPHPEKEEHGGEDAWVAEEDMLIVADGVGAWADDGIDS